MVYSLKVFEGCYVNLLYIADTDDINEADNLTENVMCQDILINVLFGCESEL